MKNTRFRLTQRLTTLVLLISICVGSVPASARLKGPQPQVNLDKQVQYEHVSFSYPSSIADSVYGETKPAVPPDVNAFPWDVAPAHAIFTFNGYSARAGFPPLCPDCPVYEPTIEVFPVAEYRQFIVEMNSLLGLSGPGSEQDIDYLQSLLSRRPDLERLSDAPPELSDNPSNALPGFIPRVNAGRSFVIKKRYVDFLTGSAIRYIAFYTQDAAPVESVSYSFQGLSRDGKYLISAMFPVKAAGLPAGPVPYDAGSEAIERYYTTISQSLDSLPNDRYNPSLDQLDALFASLSTDPSIVGVPTPTAIPPTETPIPPTATPLPNKPSIVLVHGINFIGVGCTPVKPTVYFNDLPGVLEEAGYKVFYAQLTSTPCGTPLVKDNVPKLKTAIDEARKNNPQKVIIIAHSMGGLVARAYIEDRSVYRDDVAELFTFGTLHTGVNISSELWAALFAGDCMTVGSYVRNQAVLEDFKEDVRSRFNSKTSRNKDVEYHLIGGDAPSNGRNVLGKITDAAFGTIANDGIVPLQSSTGLAGTMDRLTVPQVHSKILGAADYFTDGTESMNCIRRVLIDGTSRDCGEITTLEATPLPPLQPKKLPPGEIAQTLADYTTFVKRGVATGVCAKALLSEVGPALALTAGEYAIMVAQYAIKTGEYVGDALVTWARKAAMTTREFVELVATYAKEVGIQFVKDAARILGEWAEQASLDPQEVYDLGKEAIKMRLPFYIGMLLSPATILFTNQAGQRAGVLEDGSIVQEIPGSKVAVINGEKYVFVPPDDAITTQLKGTGTGTMTLQVIESDGSGNGEIVTHKDVPVTPQLSATIAAADAGKRLSIDIAGQGTGTQLRPPDTLEKYSPEQPGEVIPAPPIQPSAPAQSSNNSGLYIAAALIVAVVLAMGILVSLLNRKRA